MFFFSSFHKHALFKKIFTIKFKVFSIKLKKIVTIKFEKRKKEFIRAESAFFQLQEPETYLNDPEPHTGMLAFVIEMQDGVKLCTRLIYSFLDILP